MDERSEDMERRRSLAEAGNDASAMMEGCKHG